MIKQLIPANGWWAVYGDEDGISRRRILFWALKDEGDETEAIEAVVPIDVNDGTAECVLLYASDYRGLLGYQPEDGIVTKDDITAQY